MRYWLSFVVLLIGISTHLGGAAHGALMQQGFTSFNEQSSRLSFVCKGQCVVVLGSYGHNDQLRITGELVGNGQIGYGFLVGQKVYPGDLISVSGSNVYTFGFSRHPLFSQIPKNQGQLVLLVNGEVSTSALDYTLLRLSFLEKINQGLQDAFTYVPYSPRTINFLEGPKRNGVYINEYFFWWIVILLIGAGVWYMLSVHKTQKQKALSAFIGIFVFFWIFFDFFSTANQVKMYKDMSASQTIMENGRIGRGSDFYDFLTFIQTVVPKKERGYFIAPYPFDFEGKYHIYPEVSFGPITGVNYLFTYNPYGSPNQFNFVDPVYDANTKTLVWNGITFSIEKEIVWQPYAKIYILQNK